MSSESSGGRLTEWTWVVATDPAEAHALLCASDGHQAARYGMVAPNRNLDTTERRVRAGSVHLLRHGTEAAASFTLSQEPPHGLDLSVYPPATSPVYLQRLAVSPAYEGSIVGVRCLRRAVELAHERGADVLRCEANPDLLATRRMLDALGFVQHGPALAEGGVRRVHLQRTVAAG
ncbi:GNAT family N-acetyltransferase [Micromonospora rubida]